MMLRAVVGIMAKALMIGLTTAMVVAIRAVVDSNHQEPVSVVVGHVAATALWVAVAAAFVLVLLSVRKQKPAEKPE